MDVYSSNITRKSKMWWSRREPLHLPKVSGPFTPGCMDVMTEYCKEGFFVRLYYPTNNRNDEEEYKKWIPWLPDYNYIVGFSKVIMCTLFIMRLLFWWSGNVRIPVLYGAKPKTDKKLSCMILSHGLGGTRFLYSHFCCELASRGFLVAAVEHRDHSACYTYWYESKENASKDVRTPIEYRAVKLGKEHYQNRHRQVRQRADECSKVTDFLSNLNNGDVPYNVVSDVPRNQTVQFKLSDLAGNLDLDSVTMAGHSFGGATALLTMAERKELKQGVLLDPWMFSVKEENLDKRIEQPLLFINTQTFHIATNVSAMDKLMQAKDNSKMYTILHTTHENQCDSVLLIGYWLNWFMRKLDPTVALKINHFLALSFLKNYVNIASDISDCDYYLEQQKQNVEFGLTRPWA